MFKAHKLLYHSTPGSRVTQEETRHLMSCFKHAEAAARRAPPRPTCPGPLSTHTYMGCTYIQGQYTYIPPDEGISGRVALHIQKRRLDAHNRAQLVQVPCQPPLSHRMYLSIGFKKSTLPPNRQSIVYYY